MVSDPGDTTRTAQPTAAEAALQELRDRVAVLEAKTTLLIGAAVSVTLALGVLLPFGIDVDSSSLRYESLLTLAMAPTYIPGLDDADSGAYRVWSVVVWFVVAALIALLVIDVPQRDRGWVSLVRLGLAVAAIGGAVWALAMTAEYTGTDLPGPGGWVLLAGGIAALVFGMPISSRERELRKERGIQAARERLIRAGVIRDSTPPDGSQDSPVAKR